MTEVFQYKLGGPELEYDRRQNDGITERTVELPIVAAWVKQAARLGPIIEIGDVTRFFWEHEEPPVNRVIDPCGGDWAEHVSLFNVSYRGYGVISISTIEHVDDGRYGLPMEGKTPLDAYQKIAEEADRFCLTIPYGWEQGRLEVGPLQRLLLAGQPGVTVYTLSRLDELYWVPSSDFHPYSRFADTLIVAERGGLL